MLWVQESDGPFFLGENDESTRVKAMARSLKTPDSGLGPGLYDTAPASFFRHPPQVVIGKSHKLACPFQHHHVSILLQFKPMQLASDP